MTHSFSLKAGMITAIAFALISSVFLAGQVSARPPSWAAAAKPGSASIAEIAVNNGNFDTLVTALTCTNLVGAVDGNRQLTVFAPTDAAFADIGLTSENVCDTDGLANILLYHVIEGRRNSRSVLAAPSYQTLSGERLTQAELALNPELIDISARNGIVHVIDEVLLP